MSRLSKIRAKERLEEMVESVKTEDIINEIKNNKDDLDLYTYFVSKNAFNSGVLEESALNDLAIRVYSDWYFLHKNTTSTPEMIQLLDNYEYAPVNLTENKCWDLVSGGKFKTVLPIFLQYINKLQEEFFVCIKIDTLYNREFVDVKYPVRLYLNLKTDKACAFAKEFVYRSYLYEFPALLKLLNNDKRNDTITIYTDYEYAETIVDLIEEIKADSPSIFDEVGKSADLLGTIKGYIGFGEQDEDKITYLYSRAKVFESLQDMALNDELKSLIVAEEKKTIYRKEEESYTVTEYLKFLIERNARELIEEKIYSVECCGDCNGEDVEKLYAMRNDIANSIDFDNEVKKLKKAIARNEEYHLSIEDIGADNYDYLNKLYSIFNRSNEDDKIDNFDKCLKVSSMLYRMTESFENEETEKVLMAYFKTELMCELKALLDEEMQSAKQGDQNSVIINLKKKTCLKLRKILDGISNEDKDGEKYTKACVLDYIRILSLGLDEKVEVVIDGRRVVIDKDVSADLISMMPDKQQSVEQMSVTKEYIDKKLTEFGINIDNICLCATPKQETKEQDDSAKVSKEDDAELIQDTNNNNNKVMNGQSKEDVDEEEIPVIVVGKTENKESNYSYTDGEYLCNAMA